MRLKYIVPVGVALNQTQPYVESNYSLPSFQQCQFIHDISSDSDCLLMSLCLIDIDGTTTVTGSASASSQTGSGTSVGTSAGTSAGTSTGTSTSTGASADATGASQSSGAFSVRDVCHVSFYALVTASLGSVIATLVFI